MSQQRKQYTREFKREAVQPWKARGQRVTEIEKGPGLTPGLR